MPIDVVSYYRWTAAELGAVIGANGYALFFVIKGGLEYADTMINWPQAITIGMINLLGMVSTSARMGLRYGGQNQN